MVALLTYGVWICSYCWEIKLGKDMESSNYCKFCVGTAKD